ncbi:MAG: PIG-L family deacetylase [Austwickia sp.]|nr:PIG-L family deacetylase [Austwickia sp.]MBK9102352.1 PIG-L family deacetylase [Austwickia sp.]
MATVTPPIPRPPGLRRVLFAHAHPDDETLATGCLIADLTACGIHVGVVTATRGERGEVVEGPLSHLRGTPGLTPHRLGELRTALELLGVGWHAMLGTPPARGSDLPPRIYRDSGMRWLTPTLAGPADDAAPDALTHADLAEAAADLAAAVTAYRPDLLISYDAGGGYGHPDHVRMHEIALAAAELTGVALAEIVMPTDPGDDADDADGDDDANDPDRSHDPDLTWFTLPHTLPTVGQALASYASQLQVDGDHVIHVGGQRQPILTRVGLRRRLDQPDRPDRPDRPPGS